jgi:hypothetical protein
MTPDIEDLRPSILLQIATAFAKLGSPLDREQLEGMTPAEIYAAAEAMGAGIELRMTIGRWGDTLDDVDVLRHLHALNLFAGPGTTEDASFNQPDKPVTHPDYDKDCLEVLAPHLDALIERAVAAGWDRSKVAFSLMYLAAKSSRASGRGAP